MDAFKFIHCADLHLDSPFEGVRAEDADVAHELREATFRAFDNVIDLAVREQVDFIVVAGDVYDSADRSLRAQIHFRNALVRAAESGICTYLAHGNHDPLSGWEAGLPLPDRVFRFGAKVERGVHRRGGDDIALLYGVSYPDREVRVNLAHEFRKDPGAPFSVGILHCNVGGNPNHDNYAPCTVEDLVSTGLDYWALGHVHAHTIVRSERPWVVYPGNTQARNVRESGEKGCCVVRVDSSGRVECRFVPTDLIRWFAKDVDVTALSSLDDLLNELRRVCDNVRQKAAGRRAVLRILLRGRGPLHRQLARENAVDDLLAELREEERYRDDFVWVESLDNRTQPLVDLEARSRAHDFVGEFLRCVRSWRTDAGLKELRTALMSWPEHARIRSYLEELTDDELSLVLDQAEVLGFDLLAAEE